MDKKQIVVDGIEITVIKKKMKNMYLRVLPPDGRVQITAPLRTSNAKIREFAQSRLSWIKLQQEKIRSHPRTKQILYETGDIIFLWGRQYRLEICELRADEKPEVFGPGTYGKEIGGKENSESESGLKIDRSENNISAGMSDRSDADISVNMSGRPTADISSISSEMWGIGEAFEDEICGIVYLKAAAASTVHQREHFLNEWYRSQLRQAIPAVMEKYERVVGVRAKEWRIKNVKTRWGTCNTVKSRIWLNLQLAKMPPECLEYVVAHELTHLLEPSHNQRFYALMDSFYPDWRSVKKRMR